MNPVLFLSVCLQHLFQPLIRMQWRPAPSYGSAVVRGLCLLFCLLPATVPAQKLHYTILRSGKPVGSLNFQKQLTGAQTVYTLQSDVKVALLLTLTVKVNEQSVFENDVLQSSHVLRYVNGRKKADKRLRNNGRGLVVTDDEGRERELKNTVVRFNTHSLFTTEPVQLGPVFSDNYQQFLPIQKLGAQHYRLTFPDGSSNEYFYEKGRCQRVKVKSTLFDAEFVLTAP